MTVGTTWLGLTVGCAQCHDHKFDPLTQREYYQLYAFFNNADEANFNAPLRGLYTFLQRTSPFAQFVTFDLPDTSPISRPESRT